LSGLAGLSDFAGLSGFEVLSDFAESPLEGEGESGDDDVLDFSLLPAGAALASLDGLSALAAFLRASDG
jgi:hypothetical protein